MFGVSCVCMHALKGQRDRQERTNCHTPLCMLVDKTAMNMCRTPVKHFLGVGPPQLNKYPYLLGYHLPGMILFSITLVFWLRRAGPHGIVQRVALKKCITAGFWVRYGAPLVTSLRQLCLPEHTSTVYAAQTIPTADHYAQLHLRFCHEDVTGSWRNGGIPPYSTRMCQPTIQPAVYRTTDAIGCWYHRVVWLVPVVPSDMTGTLPEVGTI